MPSPDPALQGRHVALFNWRDTANPEGGGSERYVEAMARGLAQRGARVTIVCAAHDRAPGHELRDGVRFRRRGSKLSIYPLAVLELLTRRLGRVDAVVDVQNGMPFLTRLATARPVVVLVHHVHREQWPVVYPGWTGRLGWWLESRLAVRLYRGCRYVAVSHATRDELVSLGIRRGDITVIHNGTEVPDVQQVQRAGTPTLVAVGRLVPHKQLEHAIDVVAELRARAEPELAGVTLQVVGSGWWSDQLHKYAAERGVSDIVRFHGEVSEAEKHRLVAAAWLQLLPSLKEGWGLVVGEAGMHRVPTVAYRSAGGTTESIRHGVSGVLVDTKPELTATVGRLLTQPAELAELGAGARRVAQQFTWEAAQQAFAEVLAAELRR